MNLRSLEKYCCKNIRVGHAKRIDFIYSTQTDGSRGIFFYNTIGGTSLLLNNSSLLQWLGLGLGLGLVVRVRVRVKVRIMVRVAFGLGLGLERFRVRLGLWLGCFTGINVLPSSLPLFRITCTSIQYLRYRYRISKLRKSGTI